MSHNHDTLGEVVEQFKIRFISVAERIDTMHATNVIFRLEFFA